MLCVVKKQATQKQYGPTTSSKLGSNFFEVGGIKKKDPLLKHRAQLFKTNDGVS